MNVRITKAGRATAWYANRIGNIYPVLAKTITPFAGVVQYECEINDWGVTRYINVEDCEIVSPALSALINDCENWADVKKLIRSLLPPSETIDELFYVENDGGVSVATLDWMERVRDVSKSLGDVSEATHAHTDGTGTHETE